MTVVLDTNVVLQALNPKNPAAAILDAWYAGKFIWAISTDILLEYQAVIIRQSGEERWRLFERLLDLASSYRGNVLHVSPSYQFLAVPMDRDDDKFADCAIVGQASYLVTNDRHFRTLEGSGYRAQPITPAEFMALVLAK